jgi:hypothetical protein
MYRVITTKSKKGEKDRNTMEIKGKKKKENEGQQQHKRKTMLLKKKGRS